MIIVGIVLASAALGFAVLFGTVVGMFPETFKTRGEQRKARLCGWSFIFLAIVFQLAAIAILGVHG